ncbi:MAG TPA: hypothetical protein VFF96_01055 [Pseudoxanthomonas sp.]|nr:hypothetical protein [Pseudoxanthomonas sp.]
MLRTILGMIAGLLAAMSLMFGIEGVATALFPPPPELNLRNEADLAKLVGMAPFGMKALVVFGWAVASLAGGWIAAKIARHPYAAALVVGLLIVAGCLMNVAMIPHPSWMTMLGVLLPIPLALLGARLTGKHR